MKPALTILLAALLVAVLSIFISGPTLAQTFRPYLVSIVNDAARPVPVSVVAPSTVVCTLDLFTKESTLPQTAVTCPDGVMKIDVQRILFSPDLGRARLRVASFSVTVGYQAVNGWSRFPSSGVLAVLTDAAPEATVVQPYRLDTTNGAMGFYFLASTAAGGSLFFIGTPVQ